MRIRVRVKPNSKEESINKVGEEYVIQLKAKPDKGKANTELIKILKKHFGMNAKIVSGAKSKRKIIELF